MYDNSEILIIKIEIIVKTNLWKHQYHHNNSVSTGLNYPVNGYPVNPLFMARASLDERLIKASSI